MYELKFSEDFCVLTLKNDTKFKEELTCYLKIDRRNFSVSYKTRSQTKPAKTSQNQPKASTASRNHPQQAKMPKTNKRHPLSKLTLNKKYQLSSLLEYVSETLAFLEFLRQILECLVIRVAKNIEFERVVMYPFRILCGHILYC